MEHKVDPKLVLIHWQHIGGEFSTASPNLTAFQLLSWLAFSFEAKERQSDREVDPSVEQSGTAFESSLPSSRNQILNPQPGVSEVLSCRLVKVQRTLNSELVSQ